MAEELAYDRVHTVVGINIPRCLRGVSAVHGHKWPLLTISKYDQAHSQAAAVPPGARVAALNRGCIEFSTYEDPSFLIILYVPCF